MKQRFSALDVRATVASLQQRIVGLRLQGIYDVNSKTLLLKFTKPEHKELVLVESGIRLHTTDYTRDKSIVPSGFCMKLRKHLKARRLTAVRQIGMDRVVDFEFAVAAGAQAEGTYHIICEFYASGNIILTDYQYNTLALVRVVRLEGETAFAVGKKYSLAESRDIEPVTKDQLLECLRKAGPKDTLKRTLAMLGAYGPALSEHVILRAGLTPSKRVSAVIKPGADLDEDSQKNIDALLAAYSEAFEIATKLGREVCPGYITYEAQGKSSSEDGEMFDDFGPWLFAQYKERPHKEFASFCEAADVFFSNIEAQRLKVKAHQQEAAAGRKLEAIKAEHEGRIAALERAHQKTEEQARRIEMNLAFVDQAILIIRQAVAAGMDWQDLEDLVNAQKDEGNPVAERILKLNLAANQITLELDDPADWDNDSDSESEADANSDSDNEANSSEASGVIRGPMAVDVDIFQSAFANAQRYYTTRRQAGVKHAKTLAVSTQALQSAEQKIKADLRATKVTATVSQQRKPLWFEKFSWFMSSDGYLVLAGHDMHQNELLVKRHLRPGDAYVHADLHGAASVIVKNRVPATATETAAPIPPSTLFQAGIMSVCQSRAWDAKIVTSAWWVEAHQVSKTAPTGEYLTTGSFMIRGKKNFLPPTQLVYGFGFAFRLADDESIARHAQARQQRRAVIEENARAAAATTTAAQTTMQSSAEGLEKDDEQQQQQEQPEDTGAAIALQSKSNADIDFKAAREKYNLEEVEQAASTPTDDDHQKGRSNNGAKTKGYTTAKERREQRKQRSQAPATESHTPVPKQDKLSKQEQRRLEQEQKYEKQAAKQQQQQQQKRGKKGKMRKMKEKYADQDDEDRELRMALLGASGKRNVNELIEAKMAKATLANDDSDNEESTDQQPEPSIDEEDGAAEDATDAAAPLTEMAAEPESGANNGQEDDDNEDGDDANDTSGGDQQLDVLDMITGTPLPGDNLGSAIPVCAPYAALSSYKYRVKLLPGTMKKGKACKMALTVALAAAEANKPRSTYSADPQEAEKLELSVILANREKELMKVVPEPEMIAQMLGKAKVVAANMESLRQKSKAAAKSRAKARSAKDE
ncbi:hypothetical protein GGI07_000843 [Coemansia sp. Benny D115]|nr:hypothetical protein GGI07_000843 [Coemansia sp. Benny D115]